MHTRPPLPARPARPSAARLPLLAKHNRAAPPRAIDAPSLHRYPRGPRSTLREATAEEEPAALRRLRLALLRHRVQLQLQLQLYHRTRLSAGAAEPVLLRAPRPRGRRAGYRRYAGWATAPSRFREEGRELEAHVGLSAACYEG